MKDFFFKTHREIWFLFVSLAFAIAGIVYSVSTGDESDPAISNALYFGWLIPYCGWAFISSKKAGYRNGLRDSSTLGFLQTCKDNNMGTLEYFVEDESNHTTINWWRNFRGKKTVRWFTGAYNEDSDVKSKIAFVVSEKELFTMRLKGYGDGVSDSHAMSALNDPWMTKRRSNMG